MRGWERDFNAFMETIASRLLTIARGYGITDGAEHDVVQEASLKFYRWLRRRGLLSEPFKHEGMLIKMIRQCAIDELRRRSRRPELVGQFLNEDGEEKTRELLFGVDPAPSPLQLVLRAEREVACQRLLVAVSRKRGKKVFAGLLALAEASAPSEAVAFIESYLFHRALGDAPRKDITHRLCAVLGLSENGVASGCHRLRPIWTRLKAEILGEQVRSRRRFAGGIEKLPSARENPRKSEGSRGSCPFSRRAFL